MSASHTPGPWRAGLRSHSVVADHPTPGVPGSDALDYYGGHLVAESIAPQNVALIAAAPDLLEALQLIVQWDEADLTLLDHHIERARAAIAKANDIQIAGAEHGQEPLKCRRCGKTIAEHSASLRCQPLTTKTPTSPEPLPCPFCGYVGPLFFMDGSTHRWGRVECGGCSASPGEIRREYPHTDAWRNRGLKLWNTRPPTGLSEIHKELLRECRDAIDWCANECGHSEAAALAARIDAFLDSAAINSKE